MKRNTMMKTFKEAISNVLVTMFFQPVQFVDSKCTLPEWFSDGQALVGATLSFSGPLAGSIYLLIPVMVVKDMTANFLGLEQEEIQEEQGGDTVKEAANMIGGHMLSLLDMKGAFRLGIPELLRENDLINDRLRDIEGETIFIKTEGSRLAAGIMIET